MYCIYFVDNLFLHFIENQFTVILLKLFTKASFYEILPLFLLVTHAQTSGKNTIYIYIYINKKRAYILCNYCNYLPIRCRKIRTQSGILRYGRLLHNSSSVFETLSIVNNFFNPYRANNKNTPESVSSFLSFTLPRFKILSVFFQFHPQELLSNHSNTACFNDILPLINTTRTRPI